MREDNYGMLSLLMTIPGLIPHNTRAHAMMVAVRAGFCKCTQIMLEAGLAADTVDSSGNTCLQVSNYSYMGRNNCCQIHVVLFDDSTMNPIILVSFIIRPNKDRQSDILK